MATSVIVPDVMQYAVISTGGKQYVATPGSELTIETLPHKEGDSIIFENVLLNVDGDTVTLGMPFVSGVSVSATVVRHELGDKIDILKYRPKSRYRRHMGHRQHQTVIKIESVGATKKETKPAKTKETKAADIVE